MVKGNGDCESVCVKSCFSCRLAYADFLIDSLLEKYSSQNVYIMYDVACTLQKHLKVCMLVKAELFERIVSLVSFYSSLEEMIFWIKCTFAFLVFTVLDTRPPVRFVQCHNAQCVSLL